MLRCIPIRPVLIGFFSHVAAFVFAQNVGVGLSTPAGKLHVKGSADVSQLIIDGNSTQGNINPLFKLRNSSGADLMWIHSDNVNNVFIGVDAGLLNNTGGGAHYNTFIGKGAGRTNFTGSYNTALGYNAFYSNAAGSYNTSLGTESLYYNVGSYNSALGHQSLCFNTNGTRNAASGFQALYTNDGGNENTANGYRALYSNTFANFNTAIGSGALYTQSYSNGGNNWNTNNVGVGYEALYNNQPTSTSNGLNNTAVGSYSLHTNTTGYNNSAGGSNALYSNTIGYLNAAWGFGALYSNTTGFANTAVGSHALSSNTTGDRNTAIGFEALNNNTTGFDNIAIGYGSGTASGAFGKWNTVSIGNAGWLNAYQNQVFLGNQSTSWIGGWVDWTIYSDARIKNSIREDVKGLEFITRLRPVTYHRSISAARQITGDKDTGEYPGKYDVEKVRYTGFLAQEVENAAIESGYDFSGLHKPKGEHDLYSLSYAEFVVPLVKAVQELVALNAELRKVNLDQQQQIDEQLSAITDMQLAIEELQNKSKPQERHEKLP